MKQWIYTGMSALVLTFIQTMTPSLAHANENVLAPSEALACLTRTEGALAAPIFPAEALQRKEPAELSVELTFESPKQAPRVKFNKKVDSGGFIEAVEKYVAGYRLPCLSGGGTSVVLWQEFEFRPPAARKVVWLPPVDPLDAERAAQMRCIKHISGQEKPEWSTAALKKGIQENFLVRMRYTSPDSAPQVQFLVEPFSKTLKQSIEVFAEGLRMPCLTHHQIDVDRVYKFRFLDDYLEGPDMKLVELLALGKDYPTPAYFDFNAMGCPFEVHMSYHRPYMSNGVRSVEGKNAARQPLLEWMKKITLNLNDLTKRKILGAEFTIKIPCGELDL